MYKLKLEGLVPTRAIIGLMMLSTCVIVYAVRVNMSINIIAMVEPTGNKTQHGAPECAKNNMANGTSHADDPVELDYGERYRWDQATQGYILGAYFWGYTVTSFPGGFVAERFGPKKVVFISVLLSTIGTLLTPLAASWHYIAVIVLRFLVGFVGGVVYPCIHCLISHWAPPEEKGKFATVLIGGTLGTTITWPLLGAIIEGFGWIWAFYIPGIISLLWCFLWYYLVSDSPESHPRISEDEKIYIVKALANQVSKKKAVPPYGKMFLSVPFWALAILHFGSIWGLYLLLTAGPKYMSEVLGFNLGHTGILASLPYLMRLLGSFGFGYLVDTIRKHNWMSTTTLRKTFVTFSHFIPAALLYAQIGIGCNSALSVALVTLSLGFNGASSNTNLINPQDLAPNFAGTIYGITNGIGSATGFITPLVTGYITQKNNGMAEWHQIFIIGASIYLVCGVIFCIFGSAELQSWNNVEKEEENDQRANEKV